MLSGEWSVAQVLTLLLVFVVVAPAVSGLAECVEHGDLPGMIGTAAAAAGVQKEVFSIKH